MICWKQYIFEVGDKVKTNFKGKGRWFDSRIRSVNSDGTYDIDYDDGEKDNGVAFNMIFPLKQKV